MYSKIKIFGHPIHPMMIAYPIACYTGTLVGYCLYGATGSFFWLKLAIALNVAAMASSVVPETGIGETRNKAALRTFCAARPEMLPEHHPQ